MKTIKDKLPDPVYLAYLSLLLLSLLIFSLTDTYSGQHSFGIFALHFTMAAIALIHSLTALRKRREGFLSIALLLFLISCYALNREVEIFDASANWLSAALLVTSANLLLFRFYEYLPPAIQWLSALIMGAGLIIYFYLALYLMPIYPVSVPGLLLLGVGIHTFIPGWLLIHAALLAYKRIRSLPARLALCMGITAPLAVVIVFSIQFNLETRRLNRDFHREQVESDEQLPVWVEAAMQTDNRLVQDRVLKSGLVYRRVNGDDLFFGFPSRRTDEPMIHDPLVTVAMWFSPPLTLGEDSRVRMLETLFDARHATQERLWSGEELTTTYVNTKVQVWPKLHLAYTEKVLSIYNAGSWGNEEAIYTFQLPEGGVVTSLSLWINGKEEKSILTTREKADSAYRAIVGVERRDPSLVRWQEGNTVSVRVFPVPPAGSRQFRIGFTAPLAPVKGQLHYTNCWFKGPDVHLAEEDITVEFMSAPAHPTAPGHFRRTGNTFTAAGRYRPDWAISLADEDVDSSSFSFNGYEYTLKPYIPQRTAAVTEAIYLDVNNAWTEAECRQVIQTAGRTPVYVWLNNQLLPASEENLQPLLRRPFSLFPVHRITNPATSLLITKSNGTGPHISELKGFGFHRALEQWLARPDAPALRLLDLGPELPPYLRTLREQRAFRYEKGGLLLLKVLLDSKSFAENIETPDKIVINDAALSIEKKPGESRSTAPDHLMRLFAYNHIMQQKGRGAMPDSLVALAQEAYVVTPLTSLVVLETQKDYDRFGIKDSGNSLQNASSRSKGAVPEPHEWALIVLALLTLLYVKFKPRFNRQNA